MKAKTAIKTKKAPVLWDKAHKITAYDFGDKDEFGKTIWYDDNGKAYELKYARLARQYSFHPYSAYNKTVTACGGMETIEITDCGGIQPEIAI